MFAALLTNYLPSFFGAGAVTCPLPKSTFFFLPNWWEYLNGSLDPLGKCTPDVNFPHVILPIGLAIIDMLIRLGGLVAIISIIIAGVTYITSGGNPENTVKARRRIYNSLIGLAIVFVAAGAVAFIGNSLS